MNSGKERVVSGRSQISRARESVVPVLKRFTGESAEQIPGSLPEQSIYLAPFTAHGLNGLNGRESEWYLRKSWQLLS